MVSFSWRYLRKILYRLIPRKTIRQLVIYHLNDYFVRPILMKYMFDNHFRTYWQGSPRSCVAICRGVFLRFTFIENATSSYLRFQEAENLARRLYAARRAFEVVRTGVTEHETVLRPNIRVRRLLLRDSLVHEMSPHGND